MDGADGDAGDGGGTSADHDHDGAGAGAGSARSMIAGRWIHAHEEDAGGAQVFRPAGHPLPPARGRSALELRADGTYLEHAPGPDDRPVPATGRWSLTGDRLVLGAQDGRGPGRAWTVASAGPERLVLRP